MNTIGLAIEELHRAEHELAGLLLHASDRHKADQEVHHLARDLARWSQQHVRELARVGGDYGVSLDPQPRDDNTLLAALRQRGGELLGRDHFPALLLLRDLRKIHRTSAGVSLDWEILAQTAQARQDRRLLEIARRCHPQTLRQMRWANAQVKADAAQAMTSTPS